MVIDSSFDEMIILPLIMIVIQQPFLTGSCSAVGYLADMHVGGVCFTWMGQMFESGCGTPFQLGNMSCSVQSVPKMYFFKRGGIPSLTVSYGVIYF